MPSNSTPGKVAVVTQVTIPMLTEPTAAQREAFSLLGAAIPLTLK
jgi:hypothetical protein